MRSSDIQHPMVNNYKQSPSQDKPYPHRFEEYSKEYLLPAPVCSTWEKPLRDMLAVLKDCVEMYLDEATPSMKITLPYPLSHRFSDSVWSISSSLSLNDWHYLPAGALISQHEAGKHCKETMGYYDHDNFLVLTIDYTQAALTAMILGRLCGRFHVERALHEPRFGAANLAANDDHMALKNALQQFIVLPVKCRKNERRFSSIDKVIVFGDAVNDPQIHRVLKEVLKQRPYDVVTDAYSNASQTPQPAFHAARQAAYDSGKHRYRMLLLSLPHFNMC